MEGPAARLGHGRPASLMWTRSIQAELSAVGVWHAARSLVVAL